MIGLSFASVVLPRKAEGLSRSQAIHAIAPTLRHVGIANDFPTLLRALGVVASGGVGEYFKPFNGVVT
jgi:hypothetical protein